jgi:ATP-dependent DNA ligase
MPGGHPTQSTTTCDSPFAPPHNVANSLTSRQGKDLTDWFPALAQAGKCLPPSTVLDGEIVIADEEGRADFGALQRRLGVASQRSWKAAASCPVILLVFGMLECAGTDLMQLPLIERRHRLEDVLHDLHPCLQLILQTLDPNLASEWLGEVPGLDGVVAKRADGRYRPGRRESIKVKRRRTADCVVVGVAGDESAPMLVLALHHLDGDLHHLGRLRGCHLSS